jgi:hypothetical protein
LLPVLLELDEAGSMQANERYEKPTRHARFESFEERRTLSAQPVADFLLAINEQLEHPYGEVSPALADAHNLTGINYVRDTYGLQGRGQTVAVIDSGIAYDHRALGQGLGSGHRVVGGWDFAENDADPYDDGPAGFHGTHVAGIIGSDNLTNRGVAPGADLVALRVFDDQGRGTLNWVERALQWVHDHRNSFANPITTVNLSLGSNWNSDTVPSWAQLEEELAQLERDGIFIAVAAGNSFADYRAPGLSYPAASPYVVPVASVDNNGALSSFSQRSSRVLAAPGRTITSTVPDYIFGADGIVNDFGTASGTSMAAPYAAGAAVLVREAMQIAGYVNVTQDLIYEHLRHTANVLHDTATNADYFRIDVGAAINALLSGDDHEAGLDVGSPLRDLGRVDFIRIAGQELASSENWFQFTASRDGIFTTEAFFARHAGNLHLQLYSDSRQLIADSITRPDAERLDASVIAGQKYLLKVAGTNGNVDLRLANLVALRDGTLTAVGTSGADSFTFTASNLGLSVNGINYSEWNVSSIRSVVLNGLGGTDSLVYQGSAADERVSFRTNGLSVTGLAQSFQATAVEMVQASGGSGHDVAWMFDSAGDDRLVATPESVVLSGNGFRQEAQQFEQVHAYASSGGTDVAELYDSAGNDTLRAEASIVTLAGTNMSYTAQGFDRVDAFATRGGDDAARFYDSAGNDVFTASPTTARLAGAGFNNSAQQFDRVFAYATRGGYDTARLDDSAGDDSFFADNFTATLSGQGFANSVQQFERVSAYASSGYDVARLYDSRGNDTVTGDRTGVSLSGSGFQNDAYQFDRVHANSTRGGQDAARLTTDARNFTVLAGNFTASAVSSTSTNALSRQWRQFQRAATSTARQYVLSELEAHHVARPVTGHREFYYLFSNRNCDFANVLAEARQGHAGIHADEGRVDRVFATLGE